MGFFICHRNGWFEINIDVKWYLWIALNTCLKNHCQRRICLGEIKIRIVRRNLTFYLMQCVDQYSYCRWLYSNVLPCIGISICSLLSQSSAHLGASMCTYRMLGRCNSVRCGCQVPLAGRSGYFRVAGGPLWTRRHCTTCRVHTDFDMNDAHS